jgi:hypothetical protein
MPRYVVQRTFAEGLDLPATREGADRCLEIVACNVRHSITWVHSYVTLDGGLSYCIYEAPRPEAIRSAAAASGLPVDRVTEVRILDPYFHH